MTSNTVELFGSGASLEHDPGPEHPERPDRYRALEAALSPRIDARWAEPDPAPRKALARVHAGDYLDAVFATDRKLAELATTAAGGIPRARLDADTVMSPGSLEAALRAAGGAIAVVDAALADPTRHGFALGRPPGHHAERDRAMGFCLFNSIAVAAEYAFAAYGLERVLVVDWDVHHGNGTQHSFEDRSDVLFVSCHRGGGFYPGTGNLQEMGRGDGLGFTVNLPLEAGTGDDVFCDLFDRVVGPVARDYEPQLVLISAGFDAHARDPLGGLQVTGAGFAHVCAQMLAASRDVCGGRLGLVLEGGYDLEGLVEGAAACLDVLRDRPAVAARGATPVVDRLRDAHREHWSCLA